MKTVVVGLSGGVDSALSAYLLQKEGYKVIALFMKNWDEEDQCPAEKDYQDVISICETLKIPYYTVNFTQEYQERVFQPFLEECKKGHTPNPDILCNSEIKFDLFYAKARQLGDYVATGHYARSENGQLLKGIDGSKDQSYFLHAISKEVLPQVIFPLGNMHKSEVREIAKKINLPVYQKKDSTGICFIGKRNFKQFICSYIGFIPGEIREYPSKKLLGTHDGLSYYTIGQRKGLMIGGEGEAWYVAGKNKEENILWVVQGENHPALYSSLLFCEKVEWLEENLTFPLVCKAKIRYRMPDQDCLVMKEDNGYKVFFTTPQRAVTLGQSAVFYKGDLCLGGGVITASLDSLIKQGQKA